MSSIDIVAQASFGFALSRKVEAEREKLVNLKVGLESGNAEASEAILPSNCRRLQMLEWLAACREAGDTATLPAYPLPTRTVLHHTAETASSPSGAAKPREQIESSYHSVDEARYSEEKPRPEVTYEQHRRSKTPVRCEDCKHYRPYRSPSDLLQVSVGREANKAEIANVLKEIRDDEERSKGAEARIVADQYRKDQVYWGMRPWFFAYCGLREDEGHYLIAPIKNADGLCDKFEPSLNQEAHCNTCSYRVVAPGPILDKKNVDTMFEASVALATGSFSSSSSIGGDSIARARSYSDQVFGNARARQAYELKAIFASRGQMETEPQYLDYCLAYFDSKKSEYHVCALQNQHNVCPKWKQGKAQVSPSLQKKSFDKGAAVKTLLKAGAVAAVVGWGLHKASQSADVQRDVQNGEPSCMSGQNSVAEEVDVSEVDDVKNPKSSETNTTIDTVVTSETRSFHAPSLDLDSLIEALTTWYHVQSFNVQVLNVPEGGKVIQINQEDASRKVINVSSALNILLRQKNGELTVEIGAGKWLEKAIVASSALLDIWPLLFTVAYSAWKQSCFPKLTFDFIHQFVSVSIKKDRSSN